MSVKCSPHVLNPWDVGGQHCLAAGPKASAPRLVSKWIQAGSGEKPLYNWADFLHKRKYIAHYQGGRSGQRDYQGHH